MNKKKMNLENGSVSKLLFTLAIPAIIAQLVNVLYNIVDRIFIGRMEDGQLAMAGVGVAFPIIILTSAFSSLVGMGGAPLTAIKMGEKDHDGAEKILSNCFSMLLIQSVVLTAGFYLFKEPILRAFGASEATIGFGNDYISIYLIGTIFVQIALGMNSFINTQGFAKISMMTVMIGAATNIVLDPIFIFGLDMGVKGAALATILAQLVSAIWVLLFLFGKNSIIKIRRKYLKPNFKVILPILSLGIAPFVMQSTESLVIVSLNTKLQAYGGDLAVGAMTIMSSIMQIIMLPLVGLTQGAQPIISYNFGAGRLDRVKDTFKVLLITSLAFTIILTTCLMTVPELFVSIFNDDSALIESTAYSIQIFFGGIFLFGAQIACQQTFLALGQAKISLVLALLRKVFLLVPFIYIFPMFMDDKLLAVLIAQPVADILAITITVITFTVFYKKTLSVINKDSEGLKIVN